jgi:hypothetical protein
MHEIEIPVRGTYEVQGDIVTVVYRGRKKSTQVGGSPPESIARLLLRELVQDPEGIGTSPA